MQTKTWIKPFLAGACTALFLVAATGLVRARIMATRAEAMHAEAERAMAVAAAHHPSAENDATGEK